MITFRTSIIAAIMALATVAYAADAPKPAAPPVAAKPAVANAPAPAVVNAPLSGVAKTAAFLVIKREVTPYQYEGVRDPFLSIVKAAKRARESKRQDAGSPLESYDLHQIEKGLKAIIWENDSKKTFALVGLPDGKYYTVREGMPLGIHGGTVYKILKDRIVVREILRDFRNEMKPQDTPIMLHKEEG